MIGDGHPVDRQDAQVVVVGAGYAGLIAARDLRRHGIDVLVLEARDRVGGRVHTRRTAGGWPIELGAMWFGPPHRRVQELVREYGATTALTSTDGDALCVDGDERRRASGELPPWGPHVALALWVTVRRLDAMASRIDPRRPWAARHAAEWDATSAGAWLRRNVPPGRARRLVELVLRAEACTDLDGVSLLAALTRIRGMGGLGASQRTEGGALQSLFSDGADAIARTIAAGLGDGLRLRSEVRSIHQDARGVTVAASTTTVGLDEWRDDAPATGRSERPVRAERVIVTLPPPLAGRLIFEPPLPAARDHLTQRMAMGSVYKALAVYDRPFWRELGLSGSATLFDGPVPVVADVSMPTGPGVLAVLVDARAADRMGRAGPAARRRIVLGVLTRLFGPHAADPLDWHDHHWSDDPFTRGGYTALNPPGAITTAGAAGHDVLRSPVGRVHWAGSETATEWAGFIEGAVQSGQRAAAEVRDALVG